MPNEPPISPIPGPDSSAHSEWDALLARLQAPAGGDARLLRVRHAIASGEFQVDARAIAERLIARLLVS